ncbi:CCA tRNA nucleotidyltransferase [Mycoplasmatota bacterium]|nr:CCA tRNA nucleotidyltransferase [Mycoplasmatota bacterium]
MEETARKVLKLLIDNGFEAYFVGGFVRDKLLGIDSQDIDIATSAKSEDVIKIFNKTILTGIRHGTVTVIENDFHLEVTTFRTDGDYLDNRRPSKVEFVSDIKEDLARRDFTINSFAMDYDGKLIDLYKGKEDLNNKLIRCVGEPKKRLSEDALRILRAIRFVSKLGFDIEENTYNAIVVLKDTLINISAERIKAELNKIFLGNYRNDALKLLGTLKLSVFLDLLAGIIVLKDSKDSLSVHECWATCHYLNKFDLKRWKFSNKDSKHITAISNGVKAIRNITDYDVYLYSQDLLSSNRVFKVIYGEDYKEKIESIYNSLKIKSVKELTISGSDIRNLGFTDRMIGEILRKVEYLVVMSELNNEKSEIINYIRRNYND